METGELMGYKFIEHTSDLMIEAEGDTFGHALEDLSAGMFLQMGGENALEKAKFTVSVKAANKEELVVKLLSEILAECEINGFLPKRLIIENADLENFEIKAKVLGEKKVSENIIKGVTYHQLKVEKTEEKWVIVVLFDI